MLTGWARYNVQRGGAREAGGVQANRKRVQHRRTNLSIQLPGTAMF